MEKDIKSSTYLNSEIASFQTMQIIKKDLSKLKKVFKVFIFFNFCIFSFIFIWNSKTIKNLYNYQNIKTQIENEVDSNDKKCITVKSKLNQREHPFEFINEFHFFIDLIKCKIPFSFIRFGDGENFIMKGKALNAPLDKWLWEPKNKKFQDSLIESSSICTKPNNFIGIPCKNWITVSESILSFSKCSSAKYMSFATLFINKNYHLFKDWIIDFINSSNRWKIILIANSIINKNITWAYKFFPIPDHFIENWDNYTTSLLPKLSSQAKQNNLIFFVSAGPAANVIISYLTKINNNNIYIDFGSSIEFITKGYTTRRYAKNGETAFHSCEPFLINNKSVIYI
jgi:hypothetical protein